MKETQNQTRFKAPWSSRLLRCVFLASIALLAFARDLSAHDGAHHDHSRPENSRTWNFGDDGDHLHGSFVAANDGKVQIRRNDGTLTTLAVDCLSESDREWIGNRVAEIKRLNQSRAVRLVMQNQTLRSTGQSKAAKPLIADHFKPFESTLELRWDQNFLYVGSNGMPDHPMMVGIRSWQQQVPIPQKYFGDNAWQIPLNPVPAKRPMSTKNDFLRGAIALAVNGVPIFNPLNNRGDDALLFGELDEYGGHCGRGDDYHYHIAPVHLEKKTGKNNPIAYALDGYPILGYQDKASPEFAPVDKHGGHKDKAGNYHYHATKTYPYLNGGFFGEVTYRGGQVDPQPRAQPLRPALRPMRDAKITGFSQPKPNSYQLTYDVRGKQGTVSYTIAENGSATFNFVDTDGRASSQTFTPRGRGPGDNARPRPGQQPPRRNDRPSPRDNERRPQRKNAPRPAGSTQGSTTPSRSDFSPMSRTNRSGFALKSDSVNVDDYLSIDCTCDGARRSPAIEWSGVPTDTKSFAVSLWHTAPDQEKSYWMVYNIPANVTGLKENSRGVGQLGLNDRRRPEYDAMCSRGPGVKKYHITVFALSEKLNLPSSQATRGNLLKAVKGITLAEETLDILYSRK